MKTRKKNTVVETSSSSRKTTLNCVEQFCAVQEINRDEIRVPAIATNSAATELAFHLSNLALSHLESGWLGLIGSAALLRGSLPTGTQREIILSLAERLVLAATETPGVTQSGSEAGIRLAIFCHPRRELVEQWTEKQNAAFQWDELAPASADSAPVLMTLEIQNELPTLTIAAPETIFGTSQFVQFSGWVANAVPPNRSVRTVCLARLRNLRWPLSAGMAHLLGEVRSQLENGETAFAIDRETSFEVALLRDPCHSSKVEREAQESSDRVDRIVQLLRQTTPSGFDAAYTELKSLSDLVREELAARVEPVLNAELEQRGHDSIDDKKATCKWVNGILRELADLAIKCPVTGEPSILAANPGRHPERGRFQILVTTPEGTRRATKSSDELPILKVCPDRPRIEPLSRFDATVRSRPTPPQR